jgi:diguanylate cyclase
MPYPSRAIFEHIFSPANHDLLVLLGQHVEASADELAGSFYQEMLRNEEARQYLSHELVDARLRRSMADWLVDLFRRRGPEDYAAFVSRQRRIGEVHARINVPMLLVQQGLRVIKEGLFTRLAGEVKDRVALIRAILFADDLLDYTTNLFNERYVEQIVESESQVQVMRIQMTSQNLAMDVESLRGSLLDWLRHTLTSLYQSWISGAEPPAYALSTNEFALWIEHKGQLLFADHPDIEALQADRAHLEQAYEHAREACRRKDSGSFEKALAELNDTVTKANWHLTELVRHMLEMHNLRDPLTGILSRRYLPYVMRQEIALYRRTGKSFAVLMLDVDHFKAINDEHGHAAGDAVLTQFSATLQAAVRSSDFVFRYGGEEFLILLSHATEAQALKVAEKIRAEVERHPFMTHTGTVLHVTTSIGVALYDGHPDYERVIDQADRALYRAKDAGRNRCAPYSA